MNIEPTRVRPPAVAGSFYTASPRDLQDEVHGLLAHAGAPTDSAPKALIVPHAGFVYSGAVAATAYATLRHAASAIERVVLFGPAHRVAVRSLAAPSVDAFRTPLGEVPIDRASVERLARLPGVVIDDRPHALEHSLEVQLPFLQRVLGHFELVPFVVGDAQPETVADVVEAAWGGPETLIVVSSDLSHYHDYDTARRLDAATSRSIEALAPRELGPESACGRIPVAGLLLAAQRHHLQPRALDVRSSGDTAGPRDRVVGYGAYAFYEPECAHERNGSDPHESDRAAIGLARRGVQHAVTTGRPLALATAGAAPDALGEPGACFVTLHHDGQLRGCVGELEATSPLAESILANACKAALYDTRFAPVRPAELPHVELSLSLLGPLEPRDVHSREELLGILRPDVDGVVLEEGARRATLLPSVWKSLREPEAFVAALEQKAVLSSRWSPARRVWTYAVRELRSPDPLA